METHHDERTARPDEDRPPPRRVLIASTDAATRRWGRRWLDRTGFEVETARDAAEMLRRLAARPFGLVLLDDALSRDRGGSLCSELRSVDGVHDLPVLALCSGAKQALAALQNGSTDVVLRPYDWRILIRRADLLYRAHETRQARVLAERRLRSACESAEGSRQRLHDLEQRDPLTGVSNRRAFQQTLAETIAQRRTVAVVSIGLDRFRTVNRMYGREAGDRILAWVARRLSRSVRDGDRMARGGADVPTTLARWSGDDFVIMLPDVTRSEDVVAVANRLRRVVSDPFMVGGAEVLVSASIGAALRIEGGGDAESLLHDAETAMNEAKQLGGGIVRLHSDASDESNERKLRVGRLLRGAIEREEFEIHYQPLVQLGTQRVVGAEALLRWRHPELGRVSPAEFVPLAEEVGLIDDIGRWVLRSACRQLRQWQDEGLPPIRVSVNISAQQLLRGDLVEVVRASLDEFDVDGSRLELELSERGALRSDPSTMNQLNGLKAMGIRLSVDDFGTGNSAIAYLRRFPLDALKIDRSYVSAVERNENDAAIASAMIAMAHKLRLTVVAEGVEETGQLDFLRACSCDQYQGYLFSAAVPPGRFREMLAGAAAAVELPN